MVLHWDDVQGHLRLSHWVALSMGVWGVGTRNAAQRPHSAQDARGVVSDRGCRIQVQESWEVPAPARPTSNQVTNTLSVTMHGITVCLVVRRAR